MCIGSSLALTAIFYTVKVLLFVRNTLHAFSWWLCVCHSSFLPRIKACCTYTSFTSFILCMCVYVMATDDLLNPEKLSFKERVALYQSRVDASSLERSLEQAGLRRSCSSLLSTRAKPGSPLGFSKGVFVCGTAMKFCSQYIYCGIGFGTCILQ